MLELKFNQDGLICAIAQDIESGKILMQAYMNKEAFDLTLSTGYAHYFSRSRNSLWKKGESSGNVQKVIDVSIDCDKDCVLLKVEQKGAACHTGNYSCFFEKVKAFDERAGAEMLGQLYNIVTERRKNPQEGSYTNYLFEKGIEKIAKKTGEEGVELALAAFKGDRGETISECADLIYHMTVLLNSQNITLSDVFTELYKRQNREKK